jgi:hypothetical protein
MRAALLVLAIAAVGGGSLAALLHARTGAVDRQLDADLAAALERGGVADLGRAQALGRRLVLVAGGGRPEAAALAFADARLALDFGAGTTAEAEEILTRFSLPDDRQDAVAAMAAGAKAMLLAHSGDRDGALRVATAAAAATTGVPHPLYALGRARELAGDLGGAVRALDAAVVVAPAFFAAQVARAEVLLDLGQAGSARAALEGVLAQSPGDLGAQVLLAEAEAATPTPPEAPVCTGERWRPPAIKAACDLGRAARARRAGDRRGARATAEAAAKTIPDEPRLLAHAALLLAELGAVDQAAGLLTRARRRAAAGAPALAWATASVALGRGRNGALPAGARPADPETGLVAARAALAAGGRSALDPALRELGPAARAGDADLERLARFAARRAAPTAPTSGDDPMQAYLDGLAAQLDGDQPRAAERFGHALAGHGDACRAAGEYVAALRAQKRRPERAVFAPLRAENAGCINLR